MNAYKKFIISYLVITVLLAVISVVVLRFFMPSQYTPFVFIIPVIFVFLLGVMTYLKKTVEKNGRKLHHFILLYRPVRMFLIMAFLMVYILVVREYILPFTVTFLVFYLVLLFYETVFLSKYVKEAE